jgi:hypothetical protein
MEDRAMNTRKFLLTAAASLVLVSLVSMPAGARANLTHTTYVTFSGPVSLPRTTLPAGQYTFEFPTPPASYNVVIVRRVHDSKLQWLGMTEIVARPRGTEPGTVRMS